MKFDEFTETVRDTLAVLFENENLEVVVNKVEKNNGLVLTGINIKERNAMVIPTIYIDDFYKENIEQKDIQAIAEKIKNIYRNRQPDIFKQSEIKKYQDFEWVKDKIIFTLVNYEMNKKRLEEIPYLPFHDLAIVFRCVFHKGENGIASSVVSCKDILRWGVDTKQMFQLAAYNTPRMFPPVIANITTYLKERADIPDSMFEDFAEGQGDLYVISNAFGINGAAAILYDDLLEKCADIVKDNIYIMPSSIHEMIFVNAGIVQEKDELIEIIKEVNNGVVAPSDLLSYNLYYYDRKTKKIQFMEKDK